MTSSRSSQPRDKTCNASPALQVDSLPLSHCESLGFGLQVIFLLYLGPFVYFQECVRYYLNFMLLSSSQLFRLSIQVVISISVQFSKLLQNYFCLMGSTVRTRHGKMDWFKIWKGVPHGCILSPCLFNYMQSASCKTSGWMNHRLESRFPGEISITSDMQMTPP